MVENREAGFREIDLAPHLEQTFNEGFTYIPGFLQKDTILNLQRLCSGLQFKEVFREFKHVTERYFTPEEVTPQIDRDVSSLGRSIQQRLLDYQSQFPTLEGWTPNEYSIQLYKPNSFISSHRDNASYKTIVVVVAIQGEADFQTRRTRHGKASTVRTKEGDAVFLRSTGLNPLVDGHPGIFHSVSGSLTSTDRISIGFRQTENN